MEKSKLVFPLVVFPKAIWGIIKDLERESDFPAPYTAASFFHAFACAAGNSCVCQFKENWTTSPVLFTALVGGPGAIKTHPVSFAMAPLAARDRISLAEYSKALSEYRRSPTDSRGPKPRARQRIVRDTTMEALVKVLIANPAGVCVHVDELKGWLGSFDRYRGGGGDKEAWMSLFSAESIVVNRKLQDDIDEVTNPFASVIGTIQPGVLPKLFQSELDNGFFPRLLFVYNPKDGEPVLWTEDEDLPSCAKYRWEKALAPVLNRADAFNEGEIDRMTYSFDPMAKQWIVSWQNDRERECTEEGFSRNLEFLRKIETYLIRFALVIQIMHDADAGDFGYNTTISQESAILSTTLADYYLSTIQETYETVIMGGEDVERKIRFFDALNGTFTTAQALSVAENMGIPRRSVFRMLDVGKDDPFIRKLRHGLYEKLL